LGYHRQGRGYGRTGQPAQCRASAGTRPAYHARRPVDPAGRLSGADGPWLVRRAAVAPVVAEDMAGRGCGRVRRPDRLLGRLDGARTRLRVGIFAADRRRRRTLQYVRAILGWRHDTGPLVAPAHGTQGRGARRRWITRGARTSGGARGWSPSGARRQGARLACTGSGAAPGQYAAEPLSVRK